MKSCARRKGGEVAFAVACSGDPGTCLLVEVLEDQDHLSCIKLARIVVETTSLPKMRKKLPTNYIFQSHVQVLRIYN